MREKISFLGGEETEETVAATKRVTRQTAVIIMDVNTKIASPVAGSVADGRNHHRGVYFSRSLWFVSLRVRIFFGDLIVVSFSLVLRAQMLTGSFIRVFCARENLLAPTTMNIQQGTIYRKQKILLRDRNLKDNIMAVQRRIPRFVLFAR